MLTPALEPTISKEFWFILLENYTRLSEHCESLNAAPISMLATLVSSPVSLKEK